MNQRKCCSKGSGVFFFFFLMLPFLKAYVGEKKLQLASTSHGERCCILMFEGDILIFLCFCVFQRLTSAGGQ